MHVHRLSLTNYRCYRELELVLPPDSVIVWGGNAAGKSSLLEALFLVATTKSPYATSDRQWMNWDALVDATPFARVVAEIERRSGHHVIEVIQSRVEVAGEQRFIKRLRVDHVLRRPLDVIGRLQVVLFSPQDLRIVNGAPSDRRRYLNILLCQMDPHYCRSLGEYNRVLAQRNHLLRQLRSRGGDPDELAFWEERLAIHGGHLIATRAHTVEELFKVAQEAHRQLTASGERLEVTYQVAWKADTGRGRGALGPLGGSEEVVEPTTDPARECADRLLRQWKQRRGEEIRRGMTLVGPHRDDLQLAVNGVDVRIYGSRGQQRTVALALKMAEAQMMTHRSAESPVLLLDDVLSELDAERRAHLLDLIQPGQQTLITTADLAAIPRPFRDRAHLLKVEGGRVHSVAAPDRHSSNGFPGA